MSNLSALEELQTVFPTKPLSDCLENVRVPAKVPRSSFLDDGDFPIVSQEADFINGYWNNVEDVVRIDRPVVVFGDHTQVLKLIDFDFVVGADGVKILKPKGFLDAGFLHYFLEANPIPSLGYARHYRHISGIAVPLPSMDEQKRIVAILDQAFAALDRARALAEANLADVEGLFESALKEAFSSHLDWPTKFLPEISENLDRRRVPITRHERQPGNVPYYGASGVVDQVAGHIFDDDLLLVSEDGANLLARTYPIAFSISGKSWVNNHAHVLRFDDPDTQEYVRLYLNSISLEPYVSGMAQPKLNQKALNQIPIPLPDEDRRAAIVAGAATLREHCNVLSQNYSAQLTDLANLRQSLLQKAFSGQLT